MVFFTELRLINFRCSLLIYTVSKAFLYFTKQLTVKWLCSIPKRFFRWNEQVFFTNERKMFRSFIVPEGSPLIEGSAVANIVNFQSLVGFDNLSDFNTIQFCIPVSCLDLSNGDVCRVFVVTTAWQANVGGQGSRDGAVVITLASHQCGPGSNPRPGSISGLSLLLALVLAPRVFLRVLQFSSLHKNQHF